MLEKAFVGEEMNPLMPKSPPVGDG